MKKKVLFTSFDLGVGGVSKALVNLVNNMDYDKYDITILLQIKQGDFLSQVNPNVKIEGYNLSKNKNKILRKFFNSFIFLKVLFKNFHKYDFAGCFVSGYFHSALVARLASKNNAAWIHTNPVYYMANSNLMDKKNKGLSTSKKLKKYLKRMQFRKFKNNIFVSYDGMNDYLALYPDDKKKSLVCHNLVDYQEIFDRSEEKINYTVKQRPVFLNVSRHTDYDKKLTRLIKACDKLKDDYDFSVLLIGDGASHDDYVKMVHDLNLDNYITFLGMKTNPFPYYKLADAFVLTSTFEGFPLVFLESMVMNVPIVTVDVSDAQRDINHKYGIVVPNNDDSIYDAMRQFLDNKFIIKEKFDPNKYNAESLKTIERLIDNAKN